MTQELRVIRGEPTDEELAALVTVLSAVARRPAPEAPRPVSRWRRSALPAPAGLLRPGPGAWRNSALPGA